MLKRLFLVLGLGAQAWSAADRQPVLVELFTSQGCSSCPPAEALFKELDEGQPAEGLEFIPLVLHVDYWDRLGWKDPFASPQFTQRQYAYARAWKTERVYTPQAVINGQYALVGHDRQGLLKGLKGVAALRFRPQGASLEIQGLKAGVPLWVAVTEDKLFTKVPRGENAGQALAGHGVLRRLQALPFKGSSARWKIEGNGHHVVAWQQAGSGPILNAGRWSLR